MNYDILFGLAWIIIGLILCFTAVSYYEKKKKAKNLSNWSKYEYFRLKLFIFACFFGGLVWIIIGILRG